MPHRTHAPERPHADLSALIASRICHDLVSPLGAISNGVELLQMSGLGATPEVALIAESVRNANARIRLYRVAFGAAKAGQRMAGAEVSAILSEATQGGRITSSWHGPADLPRTQAKAALLALLCLETALPYGGTIRLAIDGDHVRAEATSPRLKVNSDLWAGLEAPHHSDDLEAAHLQFAALAQECARAGQHILQARSEDRIILSF